LEELSAARFRQAIQRGVRGITGRLVFCREVSARFVAKIFNDFAGEVPDLVVLREQ
jgi:hypothetical protein